MQNTIFMTVECQSSAVIFINRAFFARFYIKYDRSDFLENPKPESTDTNTDKKPYIRPRNINLSMKITQEERDMIERRMAQAGMKTIRAYVVKMAIDGRVISVELESVREMVRLLSNISNKVMSY